MEDKKGNESAELVRTLLLSKGHGQFDLLPLVIENRFLLREKPIVLLKMIYKQLQLTPDDFNSNSFRNWLARYRKTAVSTRADYQQVDKAAGHQAVTNSVEQPFSLTDPSTLVREKESLLRRPIKPK
ncbi:hypothetical protein SAMN05444008_12073 [Cnuella takakiae]|uniref:Uncharacterized protein n=1 Tax=Cnuella takakiae TaxID=1302690 RepID=A0A1M5HV18_9BACT|nr:hypothetical protein [Cnuella takakiae]OLY95684.1 hypothetical protein BUE76_00240 [Cnuella takakiae]SHG19788.1 hypothetical protein SAMN05444008_12073 [Cnuella takakiae]